MISDYLPKCNGSDRIIGMTFALSVNLIEASKNISHSLSLKRSLSHTHPIPHEVEDPRHAYWLQRAVHLADLATGYQKLTQEGKMKTKSEHVRTNTERR